MNKVWVVAIIVILLVVFGVIYIISKSVFCGDCDLNVAKMSNNELKSHIHTLFGDTGRVVVYPDSGRVVSVLSGEVNGFGVGISNILITRQNFSYEVLVDENRCGASNETLLGFISAGGTGKNIILDPGNYTILRVLFSMNANSLSCSARYVVNVEANGEKYGSEFIDVKFG